MNRPRNTLPSLKEFDNEEQWAEACWKLVLGGGPDSPRAVKPPPARLESPQNAFDRFARHQALCLYGAVLSALVAGFLLGWAVAINLH